AATRWPADPRPGAASAAARRHVGVRRAHRDAPLPLEILHDHATALDHGGRGRARVLRQPYRPLHGRRAAAADGAVVAAAAAPEPAGAPAARRGARAAREVTVE